MNTLTQDGSAEPTDRRSHVNARGGPDTEQIEARQRRAGHEKRARDIEAAMQAAQGSMSGGWDRVGEMEAAQLAQL